MLKVKLVKLYKKYQRLSTVKVLVLPKVNYRFIKSQLKSLFGRHSRVKTLHINTMDLKWTK